MLCLIMTQSGLIMLQLSTAKLMTSKGNSSKK